MEDVLRPGARTNPALSHFHERTLVTESDEKVIWAIDAFPEHAEIQRKMARVIQRVFPGAKIHPVYVMSEESFTDRGFSNFLRPALKPMALKALRCLLDDLEIPGLRRPRVLVESSSSRPACARRFLRFAQRGEVSRKNHR